jgi:hypothetical protein
MEKYPSNLLQLSLSSSHSFNLTNLLQKAVSQEMLPDVSEMNHYIGEGIEIINFLIINLIITTFKDLILHQII